VTDVLPIQSTDLVFMRLDVLPLSIGLAIAGAAWGAAADRIAARWPRHADGHVRRVDWRTAATIVLGAAAMGALPARFTDPADLVLFGAWFAVLTLLLATDLDQRLLPDVVTLPLIPIALVLAMLGWNPLVAGHLLSAILAGVIIPAILLALSIPFGSGALGMGDVKLLVSVGLMTGLLNAATGVLVGVLIGGLVIGLLLLTRRITLRTYVPFGPFLILGAYWAVLVAI
jgi:leader peptidase (prepilin peptidase)/N-methyltransferase